MALTNPQGKLILNNNSSQQVLFSNASGALSTTGINIGTIFTTSNLVSWWRFEDNNNFIGGIKDSAYSTFGTGANPANNGLKFGTATTITGPTNGGNGLQFSEDDYIDVNNSNSLIYTTQFSIECWIKNWTNGGGGGPNFDRFLFHYWNTSGTATLGLFALRRNTHLLLYNFGTNGFDSTPDTIEALGYSDSVWNQFVLTYNSGTATGKVYINGAVVKTHTSLSSFSAPTAGNGNIVFGSNQPHGGPQSLAANIDEYKFYDKELSGTEVLANYNYYQ